MMVLTLGYKLLVPVAWAVISLTKAALVKVDRFFPPVPVVAMNSMYSGLWRVKTSLRTASVVSKGWPCERTYWVSLTFKSLQSTTTLTATEPMSMPKYIVAL